MKLSYVFAGILVVLVGACKAVQNPDVGDVGVSDVAVDAGCLDASAIVSYTPLSGDRSDECGPPAAISFTYNTAWMPGSCALTLRYTDVSFELAGQVHLSVSGDGNLFQAVGPRTAWVGVVSPCSSFGGACRFLGSCDVDIVSSGGLGDTVEIALRAPCTVPPEPPGTTTFVINSFRVRGPVGRILQQPTQVDDAREVDLSACTADM